MGKYGAHSEVSRKAKAVYDESVKPLLGAPHLWMCGHFTAKSLALMLKLIKEDLDSQRPPRNLLLWQTKSAVQPLGAEEKGWSAFQAECNKSSAFKKWAVWGDASGHPSFKGDGKVNVVSGP